jgi:signal transduction histidine kinase
MTKLQNRNEALSQFAHVASHDLRTPLMAIAGFVRILQTRYGGKLDPDFDLFLARILENTTSMAQLMTELLQYAEAGEVQDATPQTANAEEVLDAVLRNLQAVIEGSKAVVTHDPLPVVFISPTELTQLLQNLIENAIHCRRAGASPRIHVSARQNSDTSCLFSVADNGVGIAMEDREAIFKPFKRFHAKEQPGSGLGLAITQRIIKRHGGKIWVESEPGQGSVFYFAIPCATSAFRPIEQNR